MRTRMSHKLGSVAGYAIIFLMSRSSYASLQADILEWSSIEHLLVGAEYEITENSRGLQAPNRGNDFRSYFDSDGVRIHERSIAGEVRLVELTLNRFGRESRLDRVDPGEVWHSGARVEIRRGFLTEWYLNSAAGLEQGFELSTRPEGTGSIVLELEAGGARLEASGNDILMHAGERSLRYSKLFCEDADGVRLDSSMGVTSEGRLQIHVDDACAKYPVTIDPLISSVADGFFESNQPDPQGFLPCAFGGSVASAGDVNGDGFGDVIIGAPGWDGGDPHEGAAFVFLGGPNGIPSANPATAQARIESNQFGAQLGTVSGAGDVNGDGFDDIIVGAHFWEDVLPGTQLEVNGAAFVFLGSPSGIVGTDPTTAHAYIRSNELGADLGLTVASAGDVNNDGFDDVLVSVPDHGTPFPPNIPPNQMSGDIGAALLFHGSAAGITGTGFDDADTVFLSHEDTGQPLPPIFGAIGYVSGAGDVNNDGFDDVLISGSEIALFLGGPSGIPHSDLTMADARIQPGGPMGFTPFGLFAEGAGDVNGDGHDDIIAGSPFRDVTPFTARREGAVWLFHGESSGLSANDTTDADTTLIGNQLAEWFGARAQSAGDVDNDGFADVLVAARVFPGSLNSEGVTYLFRGGPAGIDATSGLDADARLEARQSGAVVLGNNAAFSAASAGDVNNDGFDDVILGKGYWDNGEENEGAAFLFHGHAWPQDPNRPPVADAGADRFVFDLDGDGFESVTLDGTRSFDPDGSIVSYAWYEGETLLGTDPILTASLSLTGDHEVALTVTDNHGLTRGDIVIARVDLLDDSIELFDGFAQGFGQWTTIGDLTLSSADSFPNPPQARIGASGSVLRHIVPVPSDAIGAELSFWLKASQFAPGDELRVRFGPEGNPVPVVLTLTAADSDDSYTFYGGSAIPLGATWLPGTISNLVVEFESSTTNGVSFVDDVRVATLLIPETLEPFCFGGGGNQFGCTPCPCGNDAPASTSGGCINEIGESGQLNASGLSSISADSLTFTAQNLTPQAFAVLASAESRLPNRTTNPCFGQDTGVESTTFDGVRCIGGDFQRHGGRPTDSSGGVGITNQPWGAPAATPILSAFIVGQTRHFQVMYRQSQSVLCGTGLNTTNAMTVLVLP